eukprot:COSAG02_NODE_1571_length_11882_cov_101.560299_2_plen_167_part_00
MGQLRDASFCERRDDCIYCIEVRDVDHAWCWHYTLPEHSEPNDIEPPRSQSFGINNPPTPLPQPPHYTSPASGRLPTATLPSYRRYLPPLAHQRPPSPTSNPPIPNFVRARQLCYRTFNSTFGNTDALRVLFDERLCQNWLSRDQCDVPKTFQNVRNDHLAVLINL